MRWIAPWLTVIVLTLAFGAGDPKPSIVVLEVDQAIGPAVSDYVQRNLRRAQDEGRALVVMRLNTPGGLDESMRVIVRDILASSVPVAVYVAPAGARAASAGTYIAYAAHIAAMAPGTNIGAATPVQLGGLPDLDRKPKPANEKETPGERSSPAGKEEDAESGAVPESDAQPDDAMTRKVVNDAVAYIRSLAELRGRNADWAEGAVREGASISAKAALAQNVIDLVVADLDALIAAINGRQIAVQSGSRTLKLDGAVIEVREPDWRSRLLAVITNPNIAYILMLLGFYGLFFELMNPGYVLPGVIGAISLLLAFYALHVLPVNYAGLALILLGIAFMVGEVFMPAFGSLGIGGVVAFVIGSVILFDVDAGYYKVSWPVIGGVAAASALFFMGVVSMTVKIHRRRAVSGREEMIGSLGEVLDDFEGNGRIRAHGEVWRARSSIALQRGEKVRIRALHGLTLDVEPLTKEE